MTTIEPPIDPPEYPAYCEHCEQVISQDWDDLTETRSGRLVCADCLELYVEEEGPEDE